MSDEHADSLVEIFKYSYEQQKDDLDRLEVLQRTYDNVFDENKWPTISKIPIATAWATVEESLGPAMEYLYPPQPFTNLMSSEDVDPGKVEDIEWALHLLMVYRMRLKSATFRSIKDCFKVGVGYGIIEPIRVQNPAAFEIFAGGNSTRQMGLGAPVTSLRYRYLSPGKVLPYPSGVDFNDLDPTPYAFVLDLYPEGEFTELFDASIYGEDALKGNPATMIAEARSRGFTSVSGYASLYDSLAGRTTGVKGTKATREDVPAMIPVLKCYQDNRHTWLFAGSENIMLFDKEGAYDTMRKPLIKWDAWMDADRWFPMSLPEADQRNVWAKNVWFNLFFDLATKGLKPTFLYDSEAVDGAPIVAPNGAVGIPGDVTKTGRYLDPPGLDQGTVLIGQQIDDNHSQITGQRDLTQFNSTRGGTMAFQDLRSTTTVREKVRHALLQLGGLESITRQVMIYMQTLGADMDLRFERPSRRPSGGEKGRRYVEHFSITEDDVKHAFTLALDLDSKQRRGAMDQQNKFAAYDRKSKSQYFDQHKVARGLCIDEQEAAEEVLPREEVEAKQAQIEAAELENIRSAGRGTGGAESTIGEQAISGAEAGGVV